MMRGECGECEGRGWIVVPRCCGKPRVLWGADRNGEPEPTGEECCGSPEPEQEHCPACNGTGRAALEATR